VQAVSEQTKQDMLQFYHLPENRITVNYNGFNRTQFNVDAAAKPNMTFSKPYILYISRLEHPGKNHLNLLKAYELLPQKIRDSYHLILGGGDWNGAEIIHNYASQSAESKNIHFLGYVNASDLKALYQNAVLYVFPSLWEGFGLSILEAMACGTPVICSNVSSLPEVGGNAVCTFDPLDPQSIAQTIQKVLENPLLQAEMKSKGLIRTEDFSWQKHVQKILA
jgi:glycosyltransferase involved in cell wall biosynthesis